MKKNPKTPSTIVPHKQSVDDKQSIKSEEPSIPEEAGSGSESVRVALRIRPLNELQLSRNDSKIVKQESEKSVQINHKDTHKNFRFNNVLGEEQTQKSVFEQCRIEELIDSAMEGYSATVFAYGQTGSGKTYTMAGKEEIFHSDTYHTSEKQGIIPRAIRLLWAKIGKQNQKVSVKASYTEIYNEQVKDLLNLSSGILHCRYNSTNGFFVQNLIVVDCSNVDDMISVLRQGMKNRKSASHEMNKDSSRSHSILTMYMITQVDQGEQSFKKYGKLSFVDLAGSQRLKESKSQGEMIKETGNINKSLFTLGKVIKGLSDKKAKMPYIPYRDSKLTMLLMDSLGGSSKALMIACASPSSMYFDETLSTLNYAARTMNIKNKPVIQMDQKDQSIMVLQMQIQQLRKQNIYLRQHLEKVSKGQVILSSKASKTIDTKSHFELPTLETFKTCDPLKSTDYVIVNYQKRFQEIKTQNEEIRKQRENSQNLYQLIMNNNINLQTKLENLEQIFLSKKKKQEKLNDQLITTSLMEENTDLKRRLMELEKLKRQMEYKAAYTSQDTKAHSVELREENAVLQQQVELLQKRQKELLDQFHQKKK